MLIMAEHSWFAKYKSDAKADGSARTDDYEALKEEWRKRAVAILCHYVPLAKEKIAVADVSTPLSIEQWLASDGGAAVGLDVTPERFCDPIVRNHLDCRTPIKNLWLTGQDTTLCGVVLAQIAGVITAMRMQGYFASMKILWYSIFKGWGMV